MSPSATSAAAGASAPGTSSSRTGDVSGSGCGREGGAGGRPSACCCAMTGDRILRKLKGGGVREHVYYKCGNQARGSDHPIVRWRAKDLEAAIERDLATIGMPSEEVCDWFRQALEAALADLTSDRQRKKKRLSGRQGDLKMMQERLLNAYLAGAVEEGAFRAKSAELKVEQERAAEAAERARGDMDSSCGDIALRVFEWTQKLGELWRGSNIQRIPRQD